MKINPKRLLNTIFSKVKRPSKEKSKEERIGLSRLLNLKNIFRSSSKLEAKRIYQKHYDYLALLGNDDPESKTDMSNFEELLTSSDFETLMKCKQLSKILSANNDIVTLADITLEGVAPKIDKTLLMKNLKSLDKFRKLVSKYDNNIQNLQNAMTNKELSIDEFIDLVGASRVLSKYITKDDNSPLANLCREIQKYQVPFYLYKLKELKQLLEYIKENQSQLQSINQDPSVIKTWTVEQLDRHIVACRYYQELKSNATILFQSDVGSVVSEKRPFIDILDQLPCKEISEPLQLLENNNQLLDIGIEHSNHVRDYLESYKGKQPPLSRLEEKITKILEYSNAKPPRKLPKKYKLSLKEFLLIKNEILKLPIDNDFKRKVEEFNEHYLKFSSENVAYISVSNLRQHLAIKEATSTISLVKKIKTYALAFFEKYGHAEYAYKDISDPTVFKTSSMPVVAKKIKHRVVEQRSPTFDNFTVNVSKLSRNVPEERKVEFREQFLKLWNQKMEYGYPELKIGDFDSMKSRIKRWIGLKKSHKVAPADIRMHRRDHENKYKNPVCIEYVIIMLIETTIDTYKELGLDAPDSLKFFGLHPRENIYNLTISRPIKALCRMGILKPYRPFSEIVDFG